MSEEISSINLYSTPPAPVEVLSTPSQLKLACSDITTGFKQWRMWLALAWQDIQLRYRRSILGPFWVTISMSITILGISWLYGYLFQSSLKEYLPYVATGIILWSLYSSLIIEGCQIFIEAENYLKQIKLSYTGLVLRGTMRNFILFLHNIIIMLPIILLFHMPANHTLFLLIPGLFIVFLSGMSYSLILAILSARYRDMTQMIASIMQVIFFLTPIMWFESKLPAEARALIDLNPFVEFLELLRMPLLGGAPSASVWIVALGVTGFGMLLAFLLLMKQRTRIIYWL